MAARARSRKRWLSGGAGDAMGDGVGEGVGEGCWPAAVS
jgi:hypothetical protein